MSPFFPGFRFLQRPRELTRLVEAARQTLPSTVTIRRIAPPNLNGTTRTEIRDLVDLYRLPKDLNVAQVRAIIAEHEAEASATTGTWFSNEQGGLVLGCRHGLSNREERFTLPNGRKVPWDKPKYIATSHDTTSTQNPWGLTVLTSKKGGAVVDSVGDLAVFKKITGPSTPQTLPIAEVPPTVGEEIFRIGKNGSFMNGNISKTAIGTTTEHPPFPRERPLSQELKDVHEELHINTDTAPGDSGGPILNTNHEIGGITTQLDITASNAIPILDGKTGKIVAYDMPPDHSLYSSVGVGTSSRDIQRLLERHDLR